MKSGRLRVAILAIVDALSIYGMLILVASLYLLMGGDYQMPLYFRLWYLPLLLISCNILMRLYNGSIIYPGASHGVIEEMRRIFLSVIVTFLLVFTYLFLTREIQLYSRAVLILTCLLLPPTLPIFRHLARACMSRFPSCQIPVFIAGAGKCGRDVAFKLLGDWHHGLRPVGFFDDFVKNVPANEGLPPILGKIDAIAAKAKEYGVEYVVVCLPLHVLTKKINFFTLNFKHIMVVAGNQAGFTIGAYTCDISGLMGVEVKNGLLLRSQRAVKWVCEFSLATVAIIMLWPVFIAIAIAVKLSSPGPIFYSAKRLGCQGKKIRVIKFRTMHANAEDHLEQILEEHPELKNEWNKKSKLANDPRITRIGKFLRKTSLDELPQFINVLLGDMAVIGPRPIVVSEKSKYGSSYDLISQVKPGITGLWQVSGRSNTSYEQRIFLDTYYVRNWSPWVDYYVFLKTVKEVCFCRGAD